LDSNTFVAGTLVVHRAGFSRYTLTKTGSLKMALCKNVVLIRPPTQSHIMQYTGEKY